MGMYNFMRIQLSTFRTMSTNICTQETYLRLQKQVHKCGNRRKCACAFPVFCVPRKSIHLNPYTSHNFQANIFQSQSY